MRGYHDIGGKPAGDVPKIELPWMPWEKQTEAVRDLLGDGTRRIVSLDEMRRGFESFGAAKYSQYSFYRRRLEAMIDILVEKGVISRDELEAAIEQKRAVWEAAAASDGASDRARDGDGDGDGDGAESRDSAK